MGDLGFLGSLAEKSDVIFLLGDPDFLLGRLNFAPISLSYRDPILGDLGFLTRLPELTQNVIRSSHGHSTPSLKISCKLVQPFSRNVADKEITKERKKSPENNTPSPYWGRGNN